jgi:hypothetical protein
MAMQNEEMLPAIKKQRAMFKVDRNDMVSIDL